MFKLNKESLRTLKKISIFAGANEVVMPDKDINNQYRKHPTQVSGRRGGIYLCGKQRPHVQGAQYNGNKGTIVLINHSVCLKLQRWLHQEINKCIKILR